jgi:hypothetical protein
MKDTLKLSFDTMRRHVLRSTGSTDRSYMCRQASQYAITATVCCTRCAHLLLLLLSLLLPLLLILLLRCVQTN